MRGVCVRLRRGQVPGVASRSDRTCWWVRQGFTQVFLGLLPPAQGVVSPAHAKRAGSPRWAGSGGRSVALRPAAGRTDLCKSLNP